VYSVLAFFFGAVAVLGVIRLLQFSKARDARLKWHVWVAVAAWYFWTVAGISFVIINVADKHFKAAGTGAFIFFMVTVLAGVLLARLTGIFNPFKSSGQQVDA